MTPRQATSGRKIEKLDSLVYEITAAWISIGTTTVAIYQQKDGESSTGKVTLSRRGFNAIIDWYQREQKERR